MDPRPYSPNLCGSCWGAPWTCRRCGSTCCEHLCSLKGNDGNATCFRCWVLLSRRDRLEGWKERALIPNQVGFQVELLLESGEIRSDEVVFQGGLHCLGKTPIGEVIGWRLPDREPLARQPLERTGR